MVERKKTRTKKIRKTEEISIEFNISESIPPSKEDEDKIRQLMEKAGETFVDGPNFKKTTIVTCIVHKPPSDS